MTHDSLMQFKIPVFIQVTLCRSIKKRGMELISEQYINISFRQLVSSLDRLAHTYYTEVEEYRMELNDLDIVKLAVSSLTQYAVRLIGPTDSLVKYRMERDTLGKASCRILVWEDMARILKHYSTDENISQNSQRDCYRALIGMMRYSLSDSRLFTVMSKYLECILKYQTDRTSKIDTGLVQSINELREQVGGKMGVEVNLILSTQYWNNSNDVRKLLAALHTQRGSLCVKELAQMCYSNWYKLVQTTPAKGVMKQIPNSFLIAKKLTILQRESSDLLTGIEKLFQILQCLENSGFNSVQYMNSVLHITDVAFELIEQVRRGLKRKSTIPNRIMEFVWLVLAIEPRQIFIFDISNYLQYVIPRIIEREMALSSRSKLEQLIVNLLFYSERCLEQVDVNICNEFSSLYQNINDIVIDSVHCPFVCESFKLAALTRKLPSQTKSNDILAIIVQFADSFRHDSGRHRCTTIKALIELSTEAVLAGEDLLTILQALLSQIIPNYSDNPHGLTRSVINFINAITIKLKSKCISLRDTVQVLMPTIGNIVNQNSNTSANSKMLLKVECCTKLITRLVSKLDFQILINHGLLLIQQVSPKEITVKEMRYLIKRIGTNFLNRKNAYLLQLARITYDKLTLHFQNEYSEIDTLFYHMLTDVPLANISHMYHACLDTLLGNKLLSPLHTIFYIQPIEPAILRIFADISTTLCFIVTNKFLTDETELSHPIVYILPSCVNEILELIHAKQIDLNSWTRLYERVMLVSFIFVGNTEIELTRSNMNNMNLLNLLDVQIPSQLLQLIVTIMKRIIYMDMKFYSPLQRKIIQFLVESIGVNIFTNLESGTIELNVLRILENIQQQIISDEFNQKNMKELLSSGYSKDLFKYNIQQQVQIQNSQIIGAEMFKPLRYGQYREFQHILKALHIGVFWFSHDKVCVYDLFKAGLSVEQTEERMRYAKMYLLKWVSKKNIPAYHLKAIQALEEERNFECKSISNNRGKKHTLTISLLTQFYNTLVSSNDTVDPAARPLGGHNEVPLEIAIRQDRGIVSIRDSYRNVEIEKCEVIFMSEGMYVMESQTDGKGINTALAWSQFFEKLLTTDCLVPSIILPRGNPSKTTWNYLHEMIGTESINTNLTWSPYYSYEWITYYPTIPEKVHDTEDIVLHPGFEPNRGSYQKMCPIWKAKTDLLGILFHHVLTTLSQTYFSSVYSNYSRYIYPFLKEILMESDNLEKQTKNRISTTCVLSNLNGNIMSAVDKWILTTDLDELFQRDRKSFFELKNFLDAKSIKGNNKYKCVRAEMKRIITDSLHFFIISELPYEIQRASMVWIEQVDDALWHETERIEHPIRLLAEHSEQDLIFFPGLVCFFLPEYKDRKSVPINPQALSPDKISGYVVGKVVELDLNDDVLNDDRTKNVQLNAQSVETFEVWGTWIAPRFRKLGVAIDLYRYTLKVLPTRFLALDMKEGVQWKCAVNVNTGCFLTWLGVVDYIMDNIVAKEVASRWNFYLGGDERHFQRYLINNRFIRPFVYIDTAVSYCNKKYSRWKVRCLLQSKYTRIIVAMIIIGVMLLIK